MAKYQLHRLLLSAYNLDQAARGLVRYLRYLAFADSLRWFRHSFYDTERTVLGTHRAFRVSLTIQPLDFRSEHKGDSSLYRAD